MHELLTDEKHKTKLCPVHGCPLQFCQTNLLNAWYCETCDEYYLEHIENKQGQITLSGKPVKCLPGKLPSIEIPPCANAPKAVSDSAKMVSQSTGDPTIDLLSQAEFQITEMSISSNVQYCPVHGLLLDNRSVKISGKDGWSKIVDIGLCKKCGHFYSNDQEIMYHTPTTAFGIPVIWNPQLFLGYRGKKSKPFFEKAKVTFQNIPIRIAKKHPVETKGVEFLADVKVRFTASDGYPIYIQGAYSVRLHGVVCQLMHYLSTVASKDDAHVLFIDPDGLLEKARSNPSEKTIKKSSKAATQKRQQYEEKQAQVQIKKEKHKQLERIALPYECYTIPLLKGSLQCPFCSKYLIKRCILRVVVYQKQAPSKIVFEKGWYCETCRTPFIDHNTEVELLKSVSPGMIYVFDAKTCSSPRHLLERTREKILIRNNLTQPPALITAKTTSSISEPHESPDILPNLSCIPGTKVFVYAEKCHCSACEKKYGKNTIQNRTALVETLKHQTVQVTVQFCTECGKYYMNLLTFRQYCKKYGGILLECFIDPGIYQKNSSWLNFQADSILSRCGYSVREGIPKEYRQTILAYILDSKKATKREILELISAFIRIRHNRMPDACKRWEEDLLFVSQYHIQNQPQVAGLSFRRVKN